MRPLDIFALFRRLLVFGVIVFVGYHVLLAGRKEPERSSETKKIKVTVNPEIRNKTELEVVQPENPEQQNPIVKLSQEEAKQQLVSNLNIQGSGSGAFRAIHLIHLHSPDDPGSRELAQSIEEVRSIHPDLVKVSTIDVAANPEKIAAWRMTSAPSVVFQTEEERLFAFEGVWPKDRLEAKVLELIHGLQRAGKDWRPAVEGMERR